MFEMLPMSPTFAPRVFSRICFMRMVVVVLPFVPVMPMTFISRLGSP